MPRAERRRRRRGGFIEKTLQAIAEFMRNEVFSEHIAREPGLMQHIDPRAKLLSVLFLIVMASLYRHPFPLVLLNLWLLWLAKNSRVPAGLFLRRVWVVVPLFTGLVVLPSLFNAIRPGTPLVTLFHLSHPVKFLYFAIPQDVAITREGSAAAILLLLRVGASVSLAVLLTLTTRWSMLLKALGVLRIPLVFIAVLDMSYRYIFLLLHTTSDMFMARKSRMAGRVGSGEGRGLVASAMGSLWGKTASLSDEVHGAMLARGYTGAPKSVSHFAMKSSDWLWLVLVLAVAALLMGSDHVFA